jgi:hypothetical protein
MYSILSPLRKLSSEDGGEEELDVEKEDVEAFDPEEEETQDVGVQDA